MKMIFAPKLLLLLIMLSGCANDPVREQAAVDAKSAKPINYGCSGLSPNDCMQLHTPMSAKQKRH